jgi:hypothetical protein
MTHRDTMLSHLKKFEQLTVEIDDWEQKTRAAVISKHAATINKLKDPLDREHVILFHMGQILAKKLVFQKMVRARDRHMNLVSMYGGVSSVLQGGPEFPSG